MDRQDRQTANRELVKILADLVEKNPELRFGQILRAYKFVQGRVQGGFHFWTDEFGLEPEPVLERVQKTVKELEPKVTITADSIKTAFNKHVGNLVAIETGCCGRTHLAVANDQVLLRLMLEDLGLQYD